MVPGLKVLKIGKQLVVVHAVKSCMILAYFSAYKNCLMQNQM